jgi:hypothetical protein
MIARHALTAETLTELGYLTIVFGGLEEQIAGFIGQLVNPGNQHGSRDLALRMGFSKKCDTLWSLCQTRYAAAPPALLQAMHKALQNCKSAASGRNDLVHGIFDYEKGRVTLARRGRTTGSLTLARIEKATAAVLDALRTTVRAFNALWNLSKGEFPQSANGVLQTSGKQPDAISDSQNNLAELDVKTAVAAKAG